MSWTSVSSKSLMKRRVFVDGDSLGRCAVMPFFRHSGDVAQVMITQSESGHVYIANPHQTRIFTTLAGSVVFENAERIDRRESISDTLDSTWHFDDEWVFAEPKFSILPFAATVKETNCVDRFYQSVTSLHFDRTLKQLKAIIIQNDDGQHHKKYGDRAMPAPPRFEKSVTGRSCWVLDAPWSR